jgi:hypothetical protein
LCLYWLLPFPQSCFQAHVGPHLSNTNLIKEASCSDHDAVKRLGWQCVTCTCADNFVLKSFISCDSLYAIDLTKSVEIESEMNFGFLEFLFPADLIIVLLSSCDIRILPNG